MVERDLPRCDWWLQLSSKGRSPEWPCRQKNVMKLEKTCLFKKKVALLQHLPVIFFFLLPIVIVRIQIKKRKILHGYGRAPVMKTAFPWGKRCKFLQSFPEPSTDTPFLQYSVHHRGCECRHGGQEPLATKKTLTYSAGDMGGAVSQTCGMRCRSASPERVPTARPTNSCKIRAYVSWQELKKIRQIPNMEPTVMIRTATVL